MSYFRFDSIGNLINLFFPIVAILVVWIRFFSAKSFDKRVPVISYSLIFSAFVLIIMALILSKVRVEYLAKTVIYNQNLSKILVASLLILSQITIIYLFTFLFNYILSKGVITYLTPLASTIFSISIIVIFTFLFTLLNQSSKIPTSKTEYGVVLGAAVWSKNRPSPIFEGRIEKAKELYLKNVIKKIFLTGGNAPGELSESETARRYLLKKKISSRSIYTESRTSSSIEQISFIKKNIVNSSDESVILITDSFHLNRILEIARFYKIKSIGIVSDYRINIKSSLNYRIKETFSLLLFWLFGL
ncbi:MAG: YdcF family protein [Melioribacteraceae bacterium]|nr:YdcF family protein [Melioribacteraceae bacterium]